MADVKKMVKKPRKKVKKKKPAKQKKQKKAVISERVRGRFKKGVSGNPSGRPKEQLNLAALLRREMQNVPEDFGGKKVPVQFRNKTWAEIFIRRFMAIAIQKGDVMAAKEIWQRVDGKVPERIIQEQSEEKWEYEYEIVNDPDNVNKEVGE